MDSQRYWERQATSPRRKILFRWERFPIKPVLKRKWRFGRAQDSRPDIRPWNNGEPAGIAVPLDEPELFRGRRSLSRSVLPALTSRSGFRVPRRCGCEGGEASEVSKNERLEDADIRNLERERTRQKTSRDKQRYDDEVRLRCDKEGASDVVERLHRKEAAQDETEDRSEQAEGRGVKSALLFARSGARVRECGAHKAPTVGPSVGS